jgi:hypothetical protein
MKIGRESILTLKATKEGPRQVLIIGSRNKPIAVRDAATGKKMYQKSSLLELKYEHFLLLSVVIVLVIICRWQTFM